MSAVEDATLSLAHACKMLKQFPIERRRTWTILQERCHAKEPVVQEIPVILLVEDRSDDVALLRRAFRVAGVLNPLVVASDGEEAINYMLGAGKYWNRAEFPLP